MTWQWRTLKADSCNLVLCHLWSTIATSRCAQKHTMCTLGLGCAGPKIWCHQSTCAGHHLMRGLQQTSCQQHISVMPAPMMTTKGVSEMRRSLQDSWHSSAATVAAELGHGICQVQAPVCLENAYDQKQHVHVGSSSSTCDRSCHKVTPSTGIDKQTCCCT